MDCPGSRLQLELAASLTDRLIVRNAGREAAEAFWNDNSFDLLEDTEPDLDSEDSGMETLPEMEIIWHNIFECD